MKFEGFDLVVKSREKKTPPYCPWMVGWPPNTRTPLYHHLLPFQTSPKSFPPSFLPSHPFLFPWVSRALLAEGGHQGSEACVSLALSLLTLLVFYHSSVRLSLRPSVSLASVQIFLSSHYLTHFPLSLSISLSFSLFQFLFLLLRWLKLFLDGILIGVSIHLHSQTSLSVCLLLSVSLSLSQFLLFPSVL